MSPSPTVPTGAVVIPMFNEGSVIADVLKELSGRFRLLVCVDDGSQDESVSRATAAGATVVRHPVNLGQGAALQTGIRRALQDPTITHIVTFDADGQHDAGDAAAMVAHSEAEDLQVVLGSRFLGSSAEVPLARRALLRGAARFSRATTGLQLTDAHNGLRVFRRDAAEQLSIRMHGMSHASEILSEVARHGWSYAEHPVTIRYTDYSRAKGQRAYNALNILFEVAYHRLKPAS